MTETIYAVGTVSVSNGGTTVTGVGTSWQGKILEGDLFTDPAQGIFARVTADAASNTSLSINAWPGTALSGDAYEILLTPDSVRSSERTRQLLEQLSVVQANGRGLFFLFSDSVTDADPGSGYIRLNNADPTLATAAYIDVLDANGATVSAILDSWDDEATAAARGQLWLRGVADPSAFHAYKVTGSVVDGTGYRKLTLTYVGGSGSFAADDELMVAFSAQGADGTNAILGVWQGAWVTATAYDVDDLVEQDGSTYICVEAHTSGTFATDLAADKWDLAVEKGDQGDDSTVLGPTGPKGINWQGDYSGATAYVEDDGVLYNGSSWRALGATTGNAPPTLPATSNAYWQLLARQGIDGAGTVNSVVAGTGIAVDNTDPTAPVVSAIGAASATKQIASGGYVCTDQTTVNKQIMSRTQHRARDNIKSLQLVFGNWYVNASGVETGLGGSTTITASIEYPLGTFTQVKFSGVAAGVAADGANLVSDAVAVLIPDGATFWVRSFFDSATGIVYRNTFDVNYLGGAEYAPSGLTDKTMSGSITLAGAAFPPLAIIGNTNRPSALMIGDSRTYGSSDTMDATVAVGNLERSLYPSIATINSGRNADRAQYLLASHTKRLALANYVTDVVISLGINDLIASRTAAQVETDLEGVISAFAGIPVFIATLEPVSTSSDSFATIGNQTTAASNAERVTLNAAIRSGLAGAAGYFELADSVESSRDSGKWKVTGAANGYTPDGLHANRAGSLLSRDLRVVDPAHLGAFGVTDRRLASIADIRKGASNVLVAPDALIGDGGTLVPYVAGGTSAGSGSYSVQYCQWMRIGRLVIIQGQIAYTGHTGTGSLLIKNALPFAPAVSAIFMHSSINFSYSSTAGVHPAAATSGSDIIFFEQTSGGSGAVTAMDAAATLYFSGTYFTDEV